MRKQKAIDIIKPIALDIEKKHGLLPSLTGAQVMWESGWLKHVICNNCLGIKCVGDKNNCCKGTTKEWMGDHYKTMDLWFQSFNSIQECIEKGYVRVLNLPRYEETRECDDFYTATNQVRLDGYATGPTYHLSLRDVILQNKFYEWDWTHGADEDITRNFTWKETFSSCRHRRRRYLPVITWKRTIEAPEALWENIEEVAKNIQKIRGVVNRPIVVNSWYRTPEYNAVLAGSSPRSRHLTGEAIDIRIPRGWTANKLMELAYDITDFRGFGIGKNYIHMDTRKRHAMWYY